MNRVLLWKLLFNNKESFKSVCDLHEIFINENGFQITERTIRYFISECDNKNILEKDSKIVGKRKLPVTTYKIKTTITWEQIF